MTETPLSSVPEICKAHMDGLITKEERDARLVVHLYDEQLAGRFQHCPPWPPDGDVGVRRDRRRVLVRIRGYARARGLTRKEVEASLPRFADPPIRPPIDALSDLR